MGRITNTVKTTRKTSAEATVFDRRPILEAMFSPKSVAVIGAGETPGSVGHALMKNLRSQYESILNLQRASEQVPVAK